MYTSEAIHLVAVKFRVLAEIEMRNETGEQHNKTKQNTNEMQTNAPPNSIVKKTKRLLHLTIETSIQYSLGHWTLFEVVKFNSTKLPNSNE